MRRLTSKSITQAAQVFCYLVVLAIGCIRCTRAIVNSGQYILLKNSKCLLSLNYTPSYQNYVLLLILCDSYKLCILY